MQQTLWKQPARHDSLTEHECQRRLIAALGIADERAISREQDASRRLRLLEQLNHAKACLKRQRADSGSNARAVFWAMREMQRLSSRV